MSKKSASDKIYLQAALEQMTHDPKIVQMISAATKLGIADLLKDGSTGSVSLAAYTR